MVAAGEHRLHPARADEAGVAAADQLAIPARAVLPIEGHDFTVRVEARVHPRPLEAHERQQAERVGAAERRLVGDQLRERHRGAAKLAADRLLVRREVALVEEQVERGVRDLECFRPLLGPGQLELDALQALADPDHPLLDRGFGREQGTRGGGHAETAQRAEDQGELALGAQAGMAAHEDHPELVVADHVLAEGFPHGRGERPLAVEVAREVGGEGATRLLPADGVDRAVTRGGEQPRGRVVGNPGLPPGLERGHERGLHHVLRELQVVGAEEARQDRDQPARLPSEDGLDLDVDRASRRGDHRAPMLARPRPRARSRRSGRSAALLRGRLASPPRSWPSSIPRRGARPWSGP